MPSVKCVSHMDISETKTKRGSLRSRFTIATNSRFSEQRSLIHLSLHLLLLMEIFSWEYTRLVPRPPEVEEVAYMAVYVMSSLVAV